MPAIGPMELMVVGVLALIVFGPDRLPGMLKTAGRTIGEFRRVASGVKSEFTSGLNDDAPVRREPAVAAGSTTEGKSE
jgi:Tat protein translocase TatB subunit